MSNVYELAKWIYKPNSGFRAGEHWMLKPLTGAGKVTVARASDKWCLNESGVLVKRKANITPLDWLDGEDYSLIEPSSTNQLHQNRNLQTGWSLGANLSSVDTTICGQYARQITVDVAGSTGLTLNTFQRNQNISIVSGSTYTVSLLAKKATSHSTFNIWFFNTGGSLATSYDLDSKTAVVTVNSTNHTNVTGRVSNYDTSEGAFLIELTFTSAVTGDFTILSFQPTNGTNSASVGNTMIFSWPQFEAGGKASSRIESTTTATARSSDVCSVSNVSSLIGQTNGTIFSSAHFGTDDKLSDRQMIELSDGTTSNRIFISKYRNNRVLGFVVVGGVTQASLFPGTIYSGVVKSILRYEKDNFKLFVNGIEGANVISGSVPATSKINFGSISGGSGLLNDRLGLCWGTDELLSDAKCLELTA